MNNSPSNWKPFLLNKLFVVKMGDKLDKNKMTDDDPTVNFVSRISYNNGVDIKVDKIHGKTPNEAGLMTVSLGGEYLGSCYVQKEPFYTAQNVAILTPRTSFITDIVKEFICALVKYECKTKYYAFGRELNTHINRDFTINLPIQYNSDNKPFFDADKVYSEDGYVPDWQFMEDYIKSLHYKPLTSSNNSLNSYQLNTTMWEEFEIPKLFEVSAGIYHYPSEYEGGATPYVSASDSNNGIAEYISLKPDFTKNKITIGKIGAKAFYQSEDFCATSDVNILEPLFDMNTYIALFIVRVLNFSENYKWSYGRQCRVGDTNEIIIKLPILRDSTGQPLIDSSRKFHKMGYTPDWDYIENYIKSLPYGDRLKYI